MAELFNGCGGAQMNSTVTDSFETEGICSPEERRLQQALVTTRDWQIGHQRVVPGTGMFHGGAVAGFRSVVFPRRSVGLIRGVDWYQLADNTKVVLLNADSYVRRKVVDPEGDDSFWYWLSDDLLEEIRLALGDRGRRLGPRFTHLEVPCSRQMFRLERWIAHQIVAPGPTDPALLEEHVLQLLEWTLQLTVDDQQWLSPTSGTGRLVDRADQYLAAHFSEAPDLTEVAAAVGASKYHLARVYHQHRGMTLHEKRTELQVRAAYDLLPTREIPLAQIALQLGFSSSSHFSTRFKQVIGVSPSSLRRGVSPPR